MFFCRKAVILAFEGPDRYAQVGGLGVRVVELGHALAELGVATELVFAGDPAGPRSEHAAENLTYHRAIQDTSRDYPGGVYEGEYNKVDALAASAPQYIAHHHILNAPPDDPPVLVLAEEWQTVKTVIALDRLLKERGARHRALILWNANNTFGFTDIDWIALQTAATITTISKFMKFEMRARGVNALVIPNGIPASLLEGPPHRTVAAFRAALFGEPLLVKVGRFDPDKRWLQAVEATAALRAGGARPQLVVRGGDEAHGREVFLRAKSLGLSVENVDEPVDSPHFFEALTAAKSDILDLRTHLPRSMLYALYAAGDAVLANSGKEPFGLVGLEVMASGGLPVCGSTGEEYAIPFVNAIVCDTEDGLELATYLSETFADPRGVLHMHEAARATAARYTWPTVINVLHRKLEFLIAMRMRNHTPS